tara:strand:+ start:33 stop:371 length:339 start_codon:yes stop_codon:yes gene_type:complete
MAKAKLWLPVSAGNQRRNLRQVSPPADLERVMGSMEEETFSVGPNGQPVYVPGASRLSGHQLDEILHKATEQAEEEANAAQPAQAVSREKMDDLKGALRSIADWRKDRRNNN